MPAFSFLFYFLFGAVLNLRALRDTEIAAALRENACRVDRRLARFGYPESLSGAGCSAERVESI